MNPFETGGKLPMKSSANKGFSANTAKNGFLIKKIILIEERYFLNKENLIKAPVHKNYWVIPNVYQ